MHEHVPLSLFPVYGARAVYKPQLEDWEEILTEIGKKCIRLLMTSPLNVSEMFQQLLSDFHNKGDTLPVQTKRWRSCTCSITYGIQMLEYSLKSNMVISKVWAKHLEFSNPLLR